MLKFLFKIVGKIKTTFQFSCNDILLQRLFAVVHHKGKKTFTLCQMFQHFFSMRSVCFHDSNGHIVGLRHGDLTGKPDHKESIDTNNNRLVPRFSHAFNCKNTNEKC